LRNLWPVVFAAAKSLFCCLASYTAYRSSPGKLVAESQSSANMTVVAAALQGLPTRVVATILQAECFRWG
jgi:hypothetical protein